jgi:hypothetical protein
MSEGLPWPTSILQRSIHYFTSAGKVEGLRVERHVKRRYEEGCHAFSEAAGRKL